MRTEGRQIRKGGRQKNKEGHKGGLQEGPTKDASIRKAGRKIRRYKKEARKERTDSFHVPCGGGSSGPDVGGNVIDFNFGVSGCVSIAIPHEGVQLHHFSFRFEWMLQEEEGKKR